MSNQSTVTVVLAIRPRLFRELLKHVLNAESSRFRVLEAADASPSPSMLKEADWLIVDEESAYDAGSMASDSRYGVLSLDGRGSRVRILTPLSKGKWQSISDEPTLSQLFSILSQEAEPQPG